MMERRIAALVGLALVLAQPPPAAEARRRPSHLRGSCSNAMTATQTRVTFIGRSDGTAGVVSGRIRGGRCKAHGPIAVTCGDLVSNARQCSGTAPRGCTLSGYAYGNSFQGQYQCGTTVGSLCWGSACN